MTDEQLSHSLSESQLEELSRFRDKVKQNEQRNKDMGFEPGQLADWELDAVEILRDIKQDPFAKNRVSPRITFISKGNREQN